MIKKFILLIIITIPVLVFPQDYIHGEVLDNEQKPLINATVYWENSQIGTITDSIGYFTIIKSEKINQKLIISFIGFENDTITINDNTPNYLNIILKNPNNLNTIDIKENSKGTYIDKSKTIKTQIITQKELTKAACCDLAGCFETQISVESKTTNIITNTKELSILGLAGVYNQILIDGIPIVKGLNYTYGISSIPGSLIDKIHISQGLASILQGHESITGQINIELKDNNNKETIFFNLYVNSFLEKQLNLDYNFNIGDWKSLTSFHSTQPANKVDNNNDSFLDLPQTTKYSFYNKWIYGLKEQGGLYSSITLRYLNEQRVGGEIDFDPSKDKGSNLIYGQTINFTQPEIYTKSSYLFDNGNSIILNTALSYHNQESFFGETNYLGEQLNYVTNLSYLTNWQNHKLTTGISFKGLDINEKITLTDLEKSYNGTYLTNEQEIGLFAENVFSFRNNIELITGIRIDHHNEYGIFFTPRILLKYDITENSVLRLSAGKGWRTIKFFSENIHLLGSNKNIIIHELEPEKAINLGANLLQSFYLENLEIQLIIDFYKTHFLNQISPQYSHTTYTSDIHVQNIKGGSGSNSFQVEVGLEILGSIGLKFAYNYLDVFKKETDFTGSQDEDSPDYNDNYGDNIRRQLPFTSKHHILQTLSYQPIEKNWHFDINTHWFGQKEIMNTSTNPTEHQRPQNSKSYTVVNAQFTQKLSNMDLYIGCENILNFKQENPIISWEDPFGEFFDISNIWGPTKGREIYCGIRASF